MPPEASRTVGFMCRTVLPARGTARCRGDGALLRPPPVGLVDGGALHAAGGCGGWPVLAGAGTRPPCRTSCSAWRLRTTPARCAARETAGAHRTASGRGRRAPQSVSRFPCPPARGFDMPSSGVGQTRVWRRFGERTGLSGKRPGCRRRGAGTSASSRSGASARGPSWRVCLRAHRVAVLPGWRPGREAQDGGAPPAVASLSPESPAPASPSPLPSRCSSSTRARAAGSAGCCRAACGRTPSPRSAP